MKDDENMKQYLSFRLDGEQYAIKVTSIREVLDIPPITRVPRMPEYMRGVINLRGSVVPVVDLKKKFGFTTEDSTNPEHIIVTEIHEKGNEGTADSHIVVGIFSDTVQEVLTLEKEDIEPPPRIGVKINTDFLVGMGKKDGDLLLILDIDGVLNAEELKTVKSAGTET